MQNFGTMDGETTQKCNSLESLVEQNQISLSQIKDKLNHIINSGKDYNEDIVSAIILLLQHNDVELLTLTVKTIAELAKYDEKRPIFNRHDVVNNIIKVMNTEITSDRIDLVKQCYRALGNICFDSDEGRKIIMESDLNTVLETANQTKNDNGQLADISLFFCKFMINFTIGGAEISEKVVGLHIMDLVTNFLVSQLKQDDMNEDIVQSAIMVINVTTENIPEILLEDGVIKAVLAVLKVTNDMEISESCLDILHMQAEHENVKTLLANEGAAQLVVTRLETLVALCQSGDVSADEQEVKTLMKRACELLVFILTGDEAMNILYNNGLGETYLSMLQWLDSTDYDLLSTAILTIGNFARSDSICVQIMQDNVFSKLLDTFEVYHGFSIRMSSEPNAVHPIDSTTLYRVQHAVLSALRNLAVPKENKRAIAAAGRAVPMLIKALPNIDDYNVGYKLLAALRMLVDGQESVAKHICDSSSALAAAVRLGRAGEHAGAAGEAPRLIAWVVKNTRSQTHCRELIKVDGCVSCLVNMLMASHPVMQNEALLSLTLLAMAALSESDNDTESQDTFKKQLNEAEISKHVAVLVETGCAKMPVEVAENLVAFLDVTTRKYDCSAEYVSANLPDLLKKLMNARKDFGDYLRKCMNEITNLMLSDI